MKISGEYFCGNKISEYGLQHGYLDYRTLAKAFDAVLNNNIFAKGWEMGEWEQIAGGVDYEELEELENKLEELEEKQREMIENDTENTPEYEELEKQYEELEELKNEMEEDPEIYQWFIVDGNGVDILKDCNEIVYYHEELDIYLWGVTHWGTSWDYVLTDIPCNCGNEMEG